MKIEVLVVSPFRQNARILICEKTKEAVLVDPGDEAAKIVKTIQKLEANVKYILGTHGHIDHLGAAYEMQQRLQVPCYLHRKDLELLETLPFQGQLWGVHTGGIPKIDKYLEDGECLKFGQCEGKVIHTPGHTPGSVSFLFGEDLLSGDTLFAGGIGRVDLPGGSWKDIEKSIHKLYTLSPGIKVHSGHGPSTTIGTEKSSNPYFRE